MFAIKRVLPAISNGMITHSQTMVCSFATKTPEQLEKIAIYQAEKVKYNKNVRNLRKQYAEEYAELQKQYDAIREEKARANKEMMRAKSEKARAAKAGNLRYHYEHLCNVEIMKSMRQTQGIMNQLHREREKRSHLKKMLDAHMVYLANPYKLEEVEERVLAEMKEVVPIERVYMAGPFDNFEGMTVPTADDYENSSIPDNKPITKAKVAELKKQWIERKECHVCYTNKLNCCVTSRQEHTA